MENKKKGLSKVWLGVIALVAAIAVVVGVYLFTRPETNTNQKTITVEVVLLDESSTTTTITTEAEFLRGALEQEGMVEGSEGEYGLFVTSVNGVAADDSKQQWWCFTKGGEMLSTGVDTTPIADGDAFEITLTEGY